MADLEIVYDPITVNSGPVTVDVKGLDNIKTDSKFTVTQPIDTSLTLSVPDTVKTDTKLTLSIPDTIKTDSKAAIDTRSAIDLQPVVVDQCLKLSLGALPPTLVRLPSQQRIGLTVFGVEVFGLTYQGESKVVVSDLPKHPHIVNLTAPAVVQRAAEDGHEPEGRHDENSAPRRPEKSPPFVVRLSG